MTSGSVRGILREEEEEVEVEKSVLGEEMSEMIVEDYIGMISLCPATT